MSAKIQGQEVVPLFTFSKSFLQANKQIWAAFNVILMLFATAATSTKKVKSFFTLLLLTCDLPAEYDIAVVPYFIIRFVKLFDQTSKTTTAYSST